MCCWPCPLRSTGGVYLLYAAGLQLLRRRLGRLYRAFGTAVQTGMVMVIYLEEAVTRKRAGASGTVDPGGLLRGRDGGRTAAAAPEGDDRFDRRGGPAAHHVEPFHRARR